LLSQPAEEPETLVIDHAIPDAREHYPLSSMRELVRLTCIPTTTAHRRLTQSLGFMVKDLRWVPHTLMPPQETERATLSIEFLRQLRSIEHHGWQFIITLHESWFDISTDHEQIRLPVEEQPHERPRYTIQDSKLMATFAWTPLGFHLLERFQRQHN
jgi:hypothetical protein